MEALQPITFEFSGDAATVNGEAIAAGTLADALEVFRAAPAALQAAFKEAELNQAGSDQPKPAIVANLLSTEISVKLIEEEVARRGLAVEANARTIGETQVKASFGDSLADQPDYEQELIDRYAMFVALDMALAGPGPDEAALRAAYDQDPAKYDRACAAHILVETEERANTLLAQLRAGADFAELAAANSTDPGSGAAGGELGCQARGVYVEQFEAAVWDGPLNEVQGPIRTDFGYHLIVVSERGPRTFEEARDDIADELGPAPFSALGSWLEAALPKATITVDARFGTWDSAAGQVVPVGVSAEGLELGPAGSGPAGSGPAVTGS
ncbi:MAG: peptidylprolyl isomerase [Acidimicrobiales bacterium]|nr:peptidylprolyl isomerase [Acidimicrobiales bacterium]